MKIKYQKRNWFVVMNSNLEYYAGLYNGGQLKWSSSYDDAKPLDHSEQFKMLEFLCKGEELLLDYI